MTTEIARISIVYRGYDADRSELDVVEAGKSISGMGKLYNSVFHAYLHGDAPSHWNYRPVVRAFVGAPRQGSVEWVFVAAVVYNQIAAYPQILFDAADRLIPEFVSSVILSRLGKRENMEKALETIQQLASDNSDLAKTAIADAARDKDRLFNLVRSLADMNHRPLADMASPIQARTCKTITHYDGTDHQTQLDERDADMLIADEQTEIAESETFNVVIKGADTVTGACRVRLTDTGQELRGKILDPSLRRAHNPYTASLDDQETIIIIAKPELRDGEIVKLHIVDAKAI